MSGRSSAYGDTTAEGHPAGPGSVSSSTGAISTTTGHQEGDGSEGEGEGEAEGDVHTSNRSGPACHCHPACLSEHSELGTEWRVLRVWAPKYYRKWKLQFPPRHCRLEGAVAPSMLWKWDCAALAKVWLESFWGLVEGTQLGVFFVILYFFFSVSQSPYSCLRVWICSSLSFLLYLSQAMGMPGHKKLTLQVSRLGLLVFVKVWNFPLECLCHDAILAS